MVGVVIVAHGNLSGEILKTASLIVGSPLQGVSSVSLTGQEKPDEVRERIEAAIKEVNAGHGVMVFTDMFGGTPSNIALSFLKEDKVEVVSGFNLPMLVDMVYSREGKSLRELSQQLAEIGRSSIRLASEYLRNG
ncbi:MAG: PTS sugar transporter subunit IIA [Myxococcales bacterium]|nr:PTS sugar transporter subunit IIA [Myxococcales bacterium]